MRFRSHTVVVSQSSFPGPPCFPVLGRCFIGEGPGVDAQHDNAAPPGPSNPFVGLADDGNASSA